MKKLIISLFLLTALSSCYSPDNRGASVVYGTVEDYNTKELLTGVTVKVDGTKIKTCTDLEGNFVLPDISPGNYSVKIQYLSYKELERNLKVGENEMHNVSIKLERVY